MDITLCAACLPNQTKLQKNRMMKDQKSSTKHLKIGFNCSENWNEMAGDGSIKHCEKCEKNVVDFTSISNDEIIEHVNKNKGTCARICKNQMDAINLDFKNKSPNIFHKKLAVVAIVSTLVSCSTSKEIQNTNCCSSQTTLNSYEVIAKGINPDSLNSVIIKGTVVDENGEPLLGCNIYYNDEIKTSTDFLGHFNLKLKANAITSNPLVISYIGYESFKIDIKSLINSDVKISLNQENTILLGELIIEEPNKKKANSKK